MTCLSRSTTSLDGSMLLSAISLAANGESRSATEMLTNRSRGGSWCAFELCSAYLPLSHPSTTCNVHGDEASEVYPWPLWRGPVNAFGIHGWVWLTGGHQPAYFRNLLDETLLARHVSSYRDLLLTFSLGVSDLTPNVGMWWYFVTEMFDHFRPFFVGVFHVSFGSSGQSLTDSYTMSCTLRPFVCG